MMKNKILKLAETDPTFRKQLIRKLSSFGNKKFVDKLSIAVDTKKIDKISDFNYRIEGVLVFRASRKPFKVYVDATTPGYVLPVTFDHGLSEFEKGVLDYFIRNHFDHLVQEDDDYNL